jgi:selenide,water dikinase
MGADPVLALNVAAFPGDLPSETVAQILRGGAEKVTEAHAVVAGGHTIIDAEPKYGLCVLGLVHPDRILTKAGARPGDAVYLTKPLGAGLVTTAAKFEEAKPEDLSSAVASMTRLNCCASRMARQAGVQALTDVTGYGILGHAFEMVVAGGTGIQFSASALPLLPGALDYAYRGITTGGGARNRRYLDGKVHVSPAVAEEMGHILFDPQTSGGLLFAVPQYAIHDLEDAFGTSEQPLWRVGEVTTETGVSVVP